MYEKIKSMPRLTVAAICIIMLFFPFIASEDNVSGLECIQTNGLSILLLLIPVFIILVDLNVVKLQNNMDNKLILGCSVINIALLIYSWYHTAKANEGLEELPKREMQGRPTSSANFSTKADFPMPGAPQIKTGRTVATLSNISNKSLCVTVIGKFIYIYSFYFFF